MQSTGKMHAAGLMQLARGAAACMNHQFTVASLAWGGDPQLPEHRSLAQSMMLSWRQLTTEDSD